MTFCGLRVVESAYLEEDGDPITVHRTWLERLFSRPWRPFVKTRTVVPRIPLRGAIRLNATTIVMHPAIVNELRELTERGVSMGMPAVPPNRIRREGQL